MKPSDHEKRDALIQALLPLAHAAKLREMALSAQGLSDDAERWRKMFDQANDAIVLNGRAPL